MKREYSAFIELLTHRPFTLDKSRSYSHLNRESESDRWRDGEAIEQVDGDKVEKEITRYQTNDKERLI